MFDSWLTDRLSELRSKRALGHSVREQAPKVGSGLKFEEESKETGPGRSGTLGLLLTDPTQPCSGEEGGAKQNRDLQAVGQPMKGRKKSRESGKYRREAEILVCVCVWSVCMC